MIGNSPTDPNSMDALPIILRLLSSWRLTQVQQARVLGISRRTLQRTLRGVRSTGRSLTQQRRLRSIVEISHALDTLYVNPADWFHRPNGRDPFSGQTPLAFLTAHGPLAWQAVYQLLMGDLSGQFSASAEARAVATTIPQPACELEE